jgi:hypothetical protein
LESELEDGIIGFSKLEIDVCRPLKRSIQMQSFGSHCSVHLPNSVETTNIDISPSPVTPHPRSLSVSIHADQHTLNPEKSMFHVFISYRSASDTKAVELLYSAIISECRSGKKIPLRAKTKFPDNFSPNVLAKEKLLNLFWDKETLANGRDWAGDGKRQSGGFSGAVVQSLVFVPLLTYYAHETENHSPGPKRTVESGSVGQMIEQQKPVVTNKSSTNDEQMTHSDASKEKKNVSAVDNVLLELILAKFLWEYQKAADQDQRGLTLWPCSMIYPIFGPEMKRHIADLSPRISLETNKKAVKLLEAAGYCLNKNEMLEDQPSTDDDPHPWSVRSVVGFFLNFQGKSIASWSATTLPSETDIATCSSDILRIVENSISSCREMQGHREFTNPLASEMRMFMNKYFLGHFIPVLHDHGVTSVRKLSQLENHTMALLSTHIASRFSSSEVSEFCKLRDVVMKARTEKESLPLNKRLDDFFDESASWSTALNSTCAVDLLMRKKFYLFVMIVGSILLTVTGIYLLLFPEVYYRSFPGSVQVETFKGGFTSTAILCLVAAVGLGPMCMGFSYLGTPRKGRYALAYACWLPVLIVHTIGFILEDANRPICRFLSLETTQKSVEDCVVVKCVTFGITEAFILGCFLAVVLRQEYYWPFFCLGLCIVMSCNFIIYQYSQSTMFNVVMSIICILVVLGTFIAQKISLYRTIKAANKDTESDTTDYDNIFSNLAINVDVLSNESLQRLMWDGPSPIEDSKFRQSVEQDVKDLETLYALAELVNIPFHDLIISMCSGELKDGLTSPECIKFLTAPSSNVIQARQARASISKQAKAIEAFTQKNIADASRTSENDAQQLGDAEVGIMRLRNNFERTQSEAKKLQDQINIAPDVKVGPIKSTQRAIEKVKS